MKTVALALGMTAVIFFGAPSHAATYRIDFSGTFENCTDCSGTEYEPLLGTLFSGWVTYDDSPMLPGTGGSSISESAALTLITESAEFNLSEASPLEILILDDLPYRESYDLNLPIIGYADTFSLRFYRSLEDQAVRYFTLFFRSPLLDSPPVDAFTGYELPDISLLGPGGLSVAVFSIATLAPNTQPVPPMQLIAGTSTKTLDFSATAVPAPSAVWLLGTALAVAFPRVRRAWISRAKA